MVCKKQHEQTITTNRWCMLLNAYIEASKKLHSKTKDNWWLYVDECISVFQAPAQFPRIKDVSNTDLHMLNFGCSSYKVCMVNIYIYISHTIYIYIYIYMLETWWKLVKVRERCLRFLMYLANWTYIMKSIEKHHPIKNKSHGHGSWSTPCLGGGVRLLFADELIRLEKKNNPWGRKN